ADAAQSSQVPIPLLDDPYVVLRQAQLVDTDNELDPEEAPPEVEESQPLGDDDTKDDEENESLDIDDKRKAVLTADTVVSEPLGLDYGVLRHRELAVGEDQVPSTFEVGQRSRSLPKLHGAERLHMVRPHHLLSGLLVLYQFHHHPSSSITCSFTVTTSATNISVDEDQFLKGYDRNLRELYTKPVLDLEAWVGQTDAHREALWHAIYDIQRENRDLRMQIAKERREQLELVDRVARIERRQKSWEE
nr:hypothetical protein [Tanacetum cinerariifolium]